MAERSGPDQLLLELLKLKPTRPERMAQMDEEILDVWMRELMSEWRFVE